SRLFECFAWSPIRCSLLLSVSQLRSHASIELSNRKALVAAKAWVSLYRNSFKMCGELSIQSPQAERTQKAWLALILR
ncbi:hypothetical protein, partial [Marinifaba aquimaris]|uniref:hypothetical protein n=1 Tax=Marinifaba aquimaris TaxID=2741323 RepID=UPI001C2DED88